MLVNDVLLGQQVRGIRPHSVRIDLRRRGSLLPLLLYKLFINIPSKDLVGNGHTSPLRFSAKIHQLSDVILGPSLKILLGLKLVGSGLLGCAHA